MKGTTIAIITLSSLLVGTISIIILNTNFVENKVLNPEQKTYKIPGWVKNNANWWYSGYVDDNEFSYTIQYLIDKDIIQIENCEGMCKGNETNGESE